ncbi:MAG: HTTM domain-containing protein [Deltaproteobacteria bacterium]|nr:HTTM domain-containing protein [Deltaproteobacteria bacterium]
MRRLWSAWVRLLSIRELGTSLAWFRIAVGVVILYALLSVIVADLVEVMWVDVEHGGMQPLSTSHWLAALLGERTPTVAWTLVGSGLALGVLLALGIGGRVTVFAMLQVYYAITSAKSVFAGGYDTMVTNALWILVFADSTATWSVDCRRRTGAWTSDRLVPAWPRYLIILQLVTIYGNTGIFKLSPVWTPGGDLSALYWVFQEPTWRRFDMVWTADWFWLTQLATSVTWWWEVSAPLVLLVYYFRYTADRGGRLRRVFNRFDLRKPWALIGIGLHLGILVLLNVGPFSPISLAYYLCLVTPRPPP